MKWLKKMKDWFIKCRYFFDLGIYIRMVIIASFHCLKFTNFVFEEL